MWKDFWKVKGSLAADVTGRTCRGASHGWRRDGQLRSPKLATQLARLACCVGSWVTQRWKGDLVAEGEERHGGQGGEKVYWNSSPQGKGRTTYL